MTEIGGRVKKWQVTENLMRVRGLKKGREDNWGEKQDWKDSRSKSVREKIRARESECLC